MKGKDCLTLRPSIVELAKRMEAKLAKHDDRSGWQDCDLKWLFGRVVDEMLELHEALIDYNASDIQNEAADIANFCMMIHEQAGRLINKRGRG